MTRASPVPGQSSRRAPSGATQFPSRRWASCLITTPNGMPVAWCPGRPGDREREAAAALLALAGGQLMPAELGIYPLSASWRHRGRARGSGGYGAQAKLVAPGTVMGVLAPALEMVRVCGARAFWALVTPVCSASQLPGP